MCVQTFVETKVLHFATRCLILSKVRPFDS